MKVEIKTYKPGEISRDEKKCYKISLQISNNSTVTLEAMSLQDLTNIRNSLETEIQHIQGESPRNDVASYIYYMYNYWTKVQYVMWIISGISTRLYVKYMVFRLLP